ncbi:MAG TPA: multicopper oxidase domain-containing protein [Gaiellaceae bacterium]|nr:multicopper oxidase domain-containing protein [Gaiellaceae bacterium]
MTRLSTLFVFAVPLAFGVGLWLVVLHHAEGGRERAEPSLLLHWLRDATLALPAVVIAVWLATLLADRLLAAEPALPRRWRVGLIGALTGAAASITLAAGSPLHGWLFGAQEAHTLPLYIHMARDALMALVVALPLATSLAAFLLAGRPLRAPTFAARADRRRPAVEVGPTGAVPALLSSVATLPSVPPEPRDGVSGFDVMGTLTTRRTFLRYGAGGLAAAGLTGAGIAGWSRPSRAAVVSETGVLELFVNEGHVAMVDGALVYMRGFGERPTNLTDPNPSLTIEPHVFLRPTAQLPNGQLVKSHFFPFTAVPPPEGCPTPAGPASGTTIYHVLRRQYWASFFPRRTIIAEQGSTIRLSVTNRLLDPHSFVISGDRAPGGPPAAPIVSRNIAPGATEQISFTAPPPGTYLYHDTQNAPVNRVLGLHGVLIVVPSDPWRLSDKLGAAEFERQWLWLCNDIEPEWGRLTRMGQTVDPVRTPALPRYFTLNDRSGFHSIGASTNHEINRLAREETKPCGWARETDVRNFSKSPAAGQIVTGQLIRAVNAGIAIHQLHWHGNHVFTVRRNGFDFSRRDGFVDAEGHVNIQQSEDVLELDPLDRKETMLPMKPPPDAVPVVVANQKEEFVFPMHCHAEMSQTAGGGLYPGGIVSDWILMPPLPR